MAFDVSFKMKRAATFAFTVLISSLVAGCDGANSVSIKDSGVRLATLQFTSAHEFLAEYDREITLHSEMGSKKLPFPPDTGGDLPLTVTRHQDKENDLLHFQGGIYTLVFDLRTLDYAKGSDRPENEIYSGRYKGPALPPTVAGWTIDSNLRVAQTK